MDRKNIGWHQRRSDERRERRMERGKDGEREGWREGRMEREKVEVKEVST